MEVGPHSEQVMRDGWVLFFRHQRLWDQIVDLNSGGFPAHRHPKEREEEQAAIAFGIL